MKRIQKLLAGAALLMALPAFGEGIIWHGKWNITNSIERLSLHIPIIGDVDETSGNLTLEFVENLGNVTVTITDGNGNTVYQESVETGATPNLTISLGELTDGTVTVTDGENLVYGIINL